VTLKALDQRRKELLERLEALREQKDHTAAVTVSAEYTALTEEACGAESAEAAESLFTFAVACLEAGQPVMAEQPLRRSLDLCRRHFGERHPETAARLYQLAHALANTGRGGEAEDLFRQALAVARELFGSADRRTADILFALGCLLYERGQEGPAEALFDEMASTYSVVDGGNHMAMAEHLGDIGRFYASRGRYQQAEPLLRQRLEIDRRMFAANMPADSPPHLRAIMLPCLEELAKVYEHLGQLDRAEPLVEEIVAIFTDFEPPPGDSQALANQRLRLAGLYRQTGKAERAVPLVEQALRVYRARPGQPGPLREAVEMLGELYLAAGDVARAEPLSEEAVRVAQEQQADGLTVALRLGYLAEATADAGRRADRYREAAGMLRASVGPRLDEAADLLRAEAAHHDHSGRPVAAAVRRGLLAALRLGGEGGTALSWQVGQMVADLYEVRGVNTEGGMSVVYFVWHRDWDRELVLKSPRPELLEDDAARERFLEEAETWVQLGLHPCIVSAYYARRIDGFPRVLVEKMDGGSLKTWLSQGKIRDLATALDIAVQVASGVAYAQRRRPGFVHRDLKPANVLMTPQGRAKVTDFGLVGAASGWVGTPAYMAPELWQDEPRVSPAADLYSFGVLLYELLAGRRPFDRGDDGASLGQLRGGAGPHGSLGGLAAAPGGAAGASLGQLPDRQRVTDASLGQLSGLHSFREDDLSFYRTAHCDTPPPPLCPLNAAVSPRLEALCLGLLAKDSARRPPTMSEMVAELKEVFRETVGIPYFREEPSASELRGGNLNNYAVSLLDLGRGEEAARHWEEALKAEPHHPETTYNRGLLRWRAGAVTDEAFLQQLAEVRASHGPDRPAHLIALAHFERGDCRQALAELPPGGGTESPEVAAVRALIEPHRDSGPGLLRSWHGHESSVSALALSPDGRRALSAGWDGTLKLWDLTSGDCLRTIKADEKLVLAAAVSPDWRLAVARGSEGGLRAWDLVTGECLKVFGGAPGIFGFTLCLSADGSRVLAPGADTLVQLWEVETGRCLQTFAGHDLPVTSVLLSADGQTAISQDGTTFKRWDAASGRCLASLPVGGAHGHRAPLLMDREARYLLTRLDFVRVGLVELATGRVLRVFDGHTDAVSDFAWGPDPRRMLSCGGDKTVRLWDLTNGRCRRTFTGHAAPVMAVAASADGARAVSGDEHGAIHLWDVRAWDRQAPLQLSWVLTGEQTAEALTVFRRRLDEARELLGRGEYALAATAVRAARTAPDCDRHPDALALWRNLYARLPRAGLRGGWEEHALCRHATFVQAISVSGDGRTALSAGRDGVLKVWDLRTGECRRSLQTPREEPPEDTPNLERLYLEAIWDAVLSRDGKRALAGGKDGRLRLWDLETTRCVRTCAGPWGQILAVAWGPEERHALTAGSDGVVRMWDLEDGACRQVFTGHTHPVTALAVAPDGRTFLSTGEDQTMRLWDLEDGRCLLVCGAGSSGALVPVSDYMIQELSRGHLQVGNDILAQMAHARSRFSKLPIRSLARRVLAVCFLGDGRRALRARGINLEVWDLETGRLVALLKGHEALVLSATATGDGRFAFSGAKDGSVKAWDLATGTCMRAFQGCTSEVWSVALAPDARFLMTGEFGAVEQWALDWELGEGPLSDGPPPFPPDDSDLPAVVEQFLAGDASARARLDACSAEELYFAGPQLGRHVARLTEALLGGDDVEQGVAAYILSLCGAPAAEALRRLLKDPEAPRQRAAARVLANLGPEAVPALPELFALLEGREEEVSMWAAKALYQIGTESLPLLIGGLEGPSVRVRRIAAFCLGRFGVLAEPARSALTTARRDADKNVRELAAKALEEMSEDDGQPKPRKPAQPAKKALARGGLRGWLGWLLGKRSAEAAPPPPPSIPELPAPPVARDRGQEPARPDAERGAPPRAFTNWAEAGACIDRALAHSQRGDFVAALAELDRALALDPESAAAYHNRGATHEILGHYDQAVADYTRALELDPAQAAELHANMGNALGRQGDYDRAIACYDEALRIDPSRVDAYLGRAVAHGLKERYDRSIADLTEALRLDPQSARAYDLRARAYQAVGDSRRARADRERAAALADGGGQPG
jgi:WD40 repeat protein/serine/threonine protein kinase/Tfp pilus assembly protein PilF